MKSRECKDIELDDYNNSMVWLKLTKDKWSFEWRWSIKATVGWASDSNFSRAEAYHSNSENSSVTSEADVSLLPTLGRRIIRSRRFLRRGCGGRRTRKTTRGHRKSWLWWHFELPFSFPALCFRFCLDCLFLPLDVYLLSLIIILLPLTMPACYTHVAKK